jgi:hypothetical protein
MSNKRRPQNVARKPQVFCVACKKAAGAGAVPIKGGGLVCVRCRDDGRMVQRLACGHLAFPGTMVIADGGTNWQCIRCSPHSSLPEGMRT